MGCVSDLVKRKLKAPLRSGIWEWANPRVPLFLRKSKSGTDDFSITCLPVLNAAYVLDVVILPT